MAISKKLVTPWNHLNLGHSTPFETASETRRILTSGRSMRMICVVDFRHAEPAAYPFTLDDYVDRNLEQVTNVIAVEVLSAFGLLD
jgi:hypothetical protein